MKISWDIMEKASILIALIGVPVGGLFYLVSLDHRITMLEAQMGALSLAPTLTTAGDNTHNFPNPLQESCAKLAVKAGELESVGSRVEASGVEDLMQKLACIKKKD